MKQKHFPFSKKTLTPGFMTNTHQTNNKYTPYYHYILAYMSSLFLTSTQTHMNTWRKLYIRWNEYHHMFRIRNGAFSGAYLSYPLTMFVRLYKMEVHIQGITTIAHFLFKFWQQYMAHLLSHGQLDGSG